MTNLLRCATLSIEPEQLSISVTVLISKDIELMSPKGVEHFSDSAS